jgi:hypothetical protein
MHRMLHLQNNESHVPSYRLGYGPLYKVLPSLCSMTAEFQNVYTLKEFLTVNESICAFQQHTFRYIYERKCGMKIF